MGKKIDWKDVAGRAGKTFVQAFVAAIGMDRLMEITDAESAKTVLRSMAIAGVAAGVSAAWNVVTGYFLKMEDE